jgi:hypothetical protein
VAAFIANATFKAIQAIDDRLCRLLGQSDPQALQLRFKEIQKSLNSAQQTSGLSTACHDCLGSTPLDAIQCPWACMAGFKRPWKADIAQSPCPCAIHQKPEDFVLKPSSEDAQAEHVAFSIFLQNLRRIFSPPPGQVTNAVVRRGTPLYHEMATYLAEEPASRSVSCAFALRMLLESYKCYLCGKESPIARPNCRVQALRFARDVISNIQAVLADSTMPCRCCRTLAFYLEMLQEDLTRYSQERVFDLLFQSPWVAGSHMLEMLDVTFYYGLRLCSYRNYFGAVLHTYNVLTRCNGMAPIPLLEHLCDIFSDVIFLGERPSRNLHSILLRYMGGRIRFHRKNRHRRQASYNLQLPQRVASEGLGLRKELNDDRFRYEKISLFHYIKDRDYLLEDYSLNSAPCSRKRRSSQHKHKTSAAGHENDENARTSKSTIQLQRVQQLILTEFQGDLPVAKINFFAVYIACVRIVKLISDRSHEEKDRACICFADRLLRVTDEYQGTKRAFGSFPCQELVDICEESMLAVLGQEPLAAFLWDV